MTPYVTFWKREKAPLNSLIYVLKTHQIWKKKTPFSLRAETRCKVGQNLPGVRPSQGALVPKRKKMVKKKSTYFHPKLNSEPQALPGRKEIQYCC